LGYASGGYDMAEYVKGDVVLTPYPLSGEKSFKAHPVLWFSALMSLLFVLDFFGLTDCLLARSRKELPSERR
jgi:hypothetical protein